MEHARSLESFVCFASKIYCFPCKYNFLIMFMSKKSYLKLLFSFELDSKISNFKKNRAASCPIFPILGTACPKLGTACPIGHEAALRPSRGHKNNLRSARFYIKFFDFFGFFPNFYDFSTFSSDFASILGKLAPKKS